MGEKIMGLTDLPYHAYQEVTWANEFNMINIRDKKKSFKWEKVVNNLPGKSTYGCCWPWVYKERRNSIIAADLFVYVDNGRPIGHMD